MSRPHLISTAFVRSGVAWLARRLKPWTGVAVLNYHRIGEARDSLFDHGLWSARVDDFDWQVRWLKKSFDVVTPAAFHDLATSSRYRYAAITFDDGYRDNYDLALPVLRAHNVPATFFITTGFLDRSALPWWEVVAHMVRTSSRRSSVHLPEWMSSPIALEPQHPQRTIRDLLRVYKSLPGTAARKFLAALPEQLGVSPPTAELFDSLWMSWRMVREMKAQDMYIGGHTHTHPVLSRLSADEQEYEITTCARRLREEVNIPMEAFSYPVGAADMFNETTKRLLADTGCKYAFSYYGGIGVVPPKYPFDIPRYAVESDMSRPVFSMLLSMPNLFQSLCTY